MTRVRHSARGRFTWGVLLLVVGAFALAVNLGLIVPYDFWDYWPVLLIALGLIQFFWPGSARERLGGYWLLVVGIYGWIGVFHVWNLNFYSAIPILVVAVGIRILLGGLLREGDSNRPPPGSAQS
ncbi:MAG TPA: DUF5668 domain-containing protein [Steroidobacteraceae bacterium]|nr:DUF5668 domain-containing protein [Steroidobacteraceae bacterium]